MPKAKTARLSLTLPGPLDTNGEPTSIRRSSLDHKDSIRSKSPETMTETRVSDVSEGRKGAKTPEATDEIPPERPSPQITSLPQMPMSPAKSPHTRDQSRSIFSNIRAAKSSAKIPGSDPSSRAGSAATSIHEGRQLPVDTRKPSIAGLVTPRGAPASSQEDVRSPVEGVYDTSLSESQRREALTGRIHRQGPSSSPSMSTFPSDPYQNAARKGRGIGFMRRNASHQSEETRDDSASVSETKPHPRDTAAQRNTPTPQGNSSFNPLAANDPQHLTSQKSGFFKALRTGANKTMLGMKKQRDKLTKTSSKPTMALPSTPRANPDYQYRILYAPLLDQVRATRIAARLEVSRDKTEFWLPALPWRCIDYLNYKGVEEEGIYRHSGSLQHVNYYKQKFDREGDVDLYSETELYDVNVIASLLKAWLRDLPEPIFPSHLQSQIVDDHLDDEHAPPELKQIIAQLAPWQYYLLFAITCHLSLIHASADKNKMRVDNLFTCIGSQALKLDAHLFTWLVMDWRSCWMGCTAEKAYLEAEYAYLDEKEREASEAASLVDEPQPPPSSSSRGYPDSAYGSFGNPQVSSPLSRPNPPRPFAETDGRPGSSRSQGNLRPTPSYQVTNSNDNIYDSAPSSANSSGTGSARPTGSRKASQTEMVRSGSDQRNQMQVQNHQPRAPSPLGGRRRQDNANSSRERSPLGRRVTRADTTVEPTDGAGTSTRRRAQSQPRSDTSRGKSPSSQGRRRPRGDTASGSPANRSPSQSSDHVTEKSPSGRRRREGGDAPEMPTLQKEQRERYEQQLAGASSRGRKGSEPNVKPGNSTSADEPRKTEKRREIPEKQSSKDHKHSGSLPALEKLNVNEKEPTPTSASKHERKNSKFRLSEQTFPEPISPTWKGF